MDILSPELGLIVDTYTPTAALWGFSALLIALLIAARKQYEALVYTISVAASTSSVWLLKQIFSVPRASEALVELDSFAFPSAHAAAAAFLATTLFWLYNRISGDSSVWRRCFILTVLFSFALLLGFSRIAIGVHTPLQVLGGFGIGLLVPTAVILFANYFLSFGK